MLYCVNRRSNFLYLWLNMLCAVYVNCILLVENWLFMIMWIIVFLGQRVEGRIASPGMLMLEDLRIPSATCRLQLAWYEVMDP